MIAAQFSDPKNARIILMAAGGLLVLAIALVVATVLWWRSSGVEPSALAPLEVMSTRQWWDGDDDSRRELLDEVRGQADEHADTEAPVVAPRVSAARAQSSSVQSRLDRLEQMGNAVAAPEPAAGRVAAPADPVSDDGGFGLFDQFADDSFDEPAPHAAPPAKAKGKRKQVAQPDDLWDSPPASPRRAVDPLLDDGDFW